MNYFNKLNILKKKNWINIRTNNKNNFNINKGDIITISFWHKSYNYYFEGLIIGIKKGNLINPNIILILRNILQNTIIELIGPYYLNRFFLKIFISNYKRKKIWYKSSKLYFLRKKENNASKIKN